jgi:predicted glycosyltransferase involved in capsule biosynthesis
MKQLSLIVSVLESYEVVRRQLLHLSRVLPQECELILIDDGSSPSLKSFCDGVNKGFDFTLCETNDRRPWTQPKARNIGASLARSDKLLFFDIDHVVTENVLAECIQNESDKLHWIRRPAILDHNGFVVTDKLPLLEHGLSSNEPSVHANSFMIRRPIFELLGGYDERFCGQYGGDDVDFNNRYDALVKAGLARPAEVRGEGFVYPNPAKDVMRLFHTLPRAR